jgi:hypothetical protein
VPLKLAPLTYSTEPVSAAIPAGVWSQALINNVGSAVLSWQQGNQGGYLAPATTDSVDIADSGASDFVFTPEELGNGAPTTGTILVVLLAQNEVADFNQNHLVGYPQSSSGAPLNTGVIGAVPAGGSANVDPSSLCQALLIAVNLASTGTAIPVVTANGADILGQPYPIAQSGNPPPGFNLWVVPIVVLDTAGVNIQLAVFGTGSFAASVTELDEPAASLGPPLELAFNVAVANPAAGAIWEFELPAQAHLVGVSAVLACGSGTELRLPLLNMTPNGYFPCGATVSLTAGQTGLCSWSVRANNVGPLAGGSPNYFLTGAMPDVLLPGGSTVQGQAANIQPADQWEDITLIFQPA